VHENLDLWRRHSRASTGNRANPIPPCRTAIRGVTHPEPLASELSFTNVPAELPSSQGPIELPTNTLEIEPMPSQSQRQANPGDIQGLNKPASSPPLPPAMRPMSEFSESTGPSTHRHGPSSVETPAQPSPRLRLDMDEGHRRQSSIAAPRHPPSGPPNGDRSTTELEKGKKKPRTAAAPPGKEREG